MSFFSNLFKSNSNTQASNNLMTNNKAGNTLNLSKEESIRTLNLRKNSLNTICLKKKELNDIVARVCVVMDFSGSMENLYDKGIVQALFERLLPLAIKFDDNGELESWIFSNSFARLESITEDNFYGYVNREIVNNYKMGGTEYSPVMKDVVKKYVVEEPSDVPTYVIFITDGDNSDKTKTTKIMRESSKYNIFWQFVGIGNSDFEYLTKLDEMKSRYIDNANFFKCNNIATISDTELYDKLLHEFPDWIVEYKKFKNKGGI